jgi:uncharacterized membrane protein
MYFVKKRQESIEKKNHETWRTKETLYNLSAICFLPSKKKHEEQTAIEVHSNVKSEALLVLVSRQLLSLMAGSWDTSKDIVMFWINE